MTNNKPIEDLKDTSTHPDESGDWVLTLYEPYHLPAEPKEDGDAGEGWVLTVYEPYCLPLE